MDRKLKVLGVWAATALVACGVYAGACGADCTKKCCKKKAECGTACDASKAQQAEATGQKQATVTTAALKTLLQAGADLTLLDARTGKYDDGRRIPGAVALSPKASKEDVAKVVKSKDALVVTYCSNLKCPASGYLAEHLRELGYGNVLEYSEGIAGWTEAGHAVKETKQM